MGDIDLPSITPINVKLNDKHNIIEFGDRYDVTSSLNGNETFLLAYERVNDRPDRSQKLLIKTLYRNDDAEIRRAENEVRIASLEHDNIAEYRETMSDNKGHSWYLVMKYYELGSIMRYITDTKIYRVIDRLRGPGNLMSTDDANRAVLEVLAGLKFLHENHIVHKDMKPENVLVDEYLHMKLIDFGISVFTTDGFISFTDPGTPGYFPPEVGNLYLNPSLENSYDGYKADIFSLGVTYYAFLQGVLPINDFNNVPTYAANIAEGGPDIQIVPSDDPARDHQLEISVKMMSTDPANRPTVAELENELQQ